MFHLVHASDINPTTDIVQISLNAGLFSIIKHPRLSFDTKVEMIEKLLLAKADINGRGLDYMDKEVMMAAITESNTIKIDYDLIEFLLQKGAQISPGLLCLRASAGDERFFQLAFDYNVNLNFGTDRFFTEYKTPILIAAEKKNFSLARFLVENKVNVNVTTGKNLQTPLHLAAINHHLQMLELLVEANADLQAVDIHGKVAFEYAPEFNFLRPAEIKMDQVVLDRKLIFAVGQQTSSEIIQKEVIELLELGANADCGCLIPAIKAKNSFIIPFLVEKGAKLSLAVLIEAASNDDANMCTFFVKSGIAVDEKDKKEINALMYASYFASVNAAMELIRLGADVNLAGGLKGDKTPLIWAAMRARDYTEDEYKGILKYLLSVGAQKSQRAYEYCPWHEYLKIDE